MAQIALDRQIQHQRIRGTAVAVLLIRLLEGIACWAILYGFFTPVTVPAWVVHLNFAAYGLANLTLFVPQHRAALTPRLVWLDIAANLLPMAAAAHWSGGIYSPLLPIFVVKIGSYGLIYGADTGMRSLAATAVVAVGLAVIENAGFGPGQTISQVPLLLRQRLSLAFEGLIFGILIGGGLRLFRIFQERERRLAVVVREKDALYRESLQHQQHLRRLSRKVMQVSEQTMRRVARELHDDLGQALTAVKIDLGLIDRELDADSSLRPHVYEARKQVVTALQTVRNLSQVLRPAVLDDLGLVPAMQSYISSFSDRTGIRVAMEASAAATRLPQPLEVTVYRVLQEALTNVARHADARHVEVRLRTSAEAATFEVTDDGCGFDATAFLRHPPSNHGMGIIGMRERAGTYGGGFTLESQPGGGTRVALTFSLLQLRKGSEEEHGEDPRVVG
ncbi:MAG: sensor histidine kinase [Candidatus Binatia bacterium]